MFERISRMCEVLVLEGKKNFAKLMNNEKTRPLPEGPRDKMQPQPPHSAQGPRRISRLDSRTIYLPAEITHGYQTNYRSFDESRPATSEAKRFQQTKDYYFADPASYFPKILENSIARDTREKQAALIKQSRKARQEVSGFPRRPFTSRCIQQGIAANVPVKPESVLDHSALERRERQNEQDLSADELYSLTAQNLEQKQQVTLTNELSNLYRADVDTVGYLTSEDFNSTIFKTSEEISLEEYTSSQRLTCQAEALNMPAELHGMYYFDDVDRVLLYDARSKGFRLQDASNNTIVGEFNFRSKGVSILDAVYSPMGRYVITASTSPVITLYDVDQLRVRQQIPTETAQTALELERNSVIPHLYSACMNGQVHVWSLTNLSCSHSFFTKGHEVLTDIASINTSHLATSCMNGKIYVTDLHLGLTGKALRGHDKGVTMIKYSANNGYLVSGGLDHSVNIWTPHVEQKIGSLLGHKHQLIGLEVIPDSPQVISADESGLIKIWDLRKYAPVQTFKRECYVKDHTVSRTLTRPMRSMCYIQSRKRIAIAHSSIYFVGLEEEEEHVPRNWKQICDGAEQRLDVEERSRPIAVILNRASHSILVVTPREFQSWALDSGRLTHREKISIRVDVTCVSVVNDQHSCILGTEDGTVAHAMLPHCVIILSKRLHSDEIASVRCVSGSCQVVSSSLDGTVLVSDLLHLQVIRTLNHWQGIQSMINSSKSFERVNNALYDADELKRLFKSVDYTQTGKITARKADEIIFTLLNTTGKSCTTKKVFAGRESVTLAAFVKKAQTKIKEVQRVVMINKGNGSSGPVTIDTHGQLQHLVTVSPSDGIFCVWNLKNGTVLASSGAINNHHDITGAVGHKNNEPPVGQVVYLNPYPYFVSVEEGNQSQLSIWSSKAISVMFPYGHQRVLCLQYHAPQHNCQDYGENSQPSTSTGLCASAWIYGDATCSNLFCVGDDQGYVSTYNFDGLFNEIEILRKTSSERKDSRTEHIDADGLLPSTLVCVHSQWLVRESDSIRTLCVIRDKGRSPLIGVTLDSGVTSFFTTEGQCVGNLADRSVPWQLSEYIGKSEFDDTTMMLTEMEIQKLAVKTSPRRRSQEKQDRIRNSTSTTASINHDKTGEEYARQRPGLSRFLAVANQL